jgi:cell division protein FtsW
MKSTSSLALSLLVLCTIGLVSLGIVMLSSASAAAIVPGHADVSQLVRRQVGWLIIGIIACGTMSVVDYRKMRPFVWPALGAALVLLALCLKWSPIGDDAKGSWRWIALGPLRFQPSEIAKICTIAALAAWYARNEKSSGTFLRGIVVPLLIIAAPAGLIFIEVDLGATALLCISAVLLMFVAGAALRYLVPVIIVIAVFAALFVTSDPERLERLRAFMDLKAHKNAAGWQQNQALIALGSGGIDGLGLGQGRQKMAYIPEAHNDFIFAVVGEELGLKATLSVAFAYLLIISCGTLVAVNAPDRFGALLGAGVTILIGLQASINLGVVTSLLPNKGIPLPFMSYGGSNLVVSLASIGLLIGIHRQSVYQRRAAYTAVLSVKVRGRRSDHRRL